MTLNQSFFKQASMELWEVQTTKWAVVNLNFGSCKINGKNTFFSKFWPQNGVQS